MRRGVAADPFAYPIDDFDQTDLVSRASQTMARCIEFLWNGGTRLWHGPALMGNFWTGYAWPTVITAIEVIIVVVPLLLAIAMLTYAERKVLAFSQLHKAPDGVGPFGLLQPLPMASNCSTRRPSSRAAPIGWCSSWRR